MKCRIPLLLAKQSFTRLINRGNVAPIAATEFVEEDVLQLYSISVIGEHRFRPGKRCRIR